MKGYKGFNKDLKCRDFQYEVGKDYTTEGKIEACKNGFHFCENPMDVLGYYPPSDSRYCIIESSGQEDRDGGDSKVATSKIHISAEIGLKGLIEAGVKFILDKVNWKDNKESNTGDRSAATSTGDQSAATNTGDRSAAANTGDQSAAANTGDRSAAANTGDQSAATSTGDQSAATSTGDRSAATSTGDRSAATSTGDQSAATSTGDRSAAANTGDQSAATSTGDQSAATSTGDQSAATSTGDQSAATSTGDRSAAIVSGKGSVAMAIGYKSKAKGSLGCWIVLAEQNDNYEIINVQSIKVDGEKIKADTFYTLVNGEFIETE